MTASMRQEIKQNNEDNITKIPDDLLELHMAIDDDDDDDHNLPAWASSW